MRHPFEHCRYDIGNKVPLPLTGNMGGPGEIVARSITEHEDGRVEYLYLVKSRAWPSSPWGQSWMTEERLDQYAALQRKHEREMAARRAA